MDFLRSLWPNSSSNVITIPQHIEGELEDELDLKVKSLAYLFKRLNIENLPSFINDENGVYNFDSLVGDNTVINDKLDAIYNKSEFERQLCSDEHRILIDWFKNKFRSICILSGDIPSNLEDLQLGKGFRFQILRATSTDDEIIDALLSSDLYAEHPIDDSTKLGMLKEILSNQRDLKPSFKKEFNKNDRSKIILQYLRRLSEFIQVERIYKATILKNIETYKSMKLGQIKETIDEFDQSDADTSDNGIRLIFPNNTIRSRSSSPVRSRRQSNEPAPSSSIKPAAVLRPTTPKKQPLSPVKLNSLSSTTKLTPITPGNSPLRSSQPSSPTKYRSRSSSPSKLKKKQSLTLLKMDKSLDNSEDDENTEGFISKEELQTIRTQSEQAVYFRIERERKVLRSV